MSVKRLITQWKCLFYGIECVFKVSHLPLDARSQLSSLSAIKCKGYAMWVRNFINEFHRRILDSRMRKNQLKFEIFNIVWVWNCRNVKIFPIKWHAHEKFHQKSSDAWMKDSLQIIIWWIGYYQRQTQYQKKKKQQTFGQSNSKLLPKSIQNK